MKRIIDCVYILIKSVENILLGFIIIVFDKCGKYRNSCKFFFFCRLVRWFYEINYI